MFVPLLVTFDTVNPCCSEYAGVILSITDEPMCCVFSRQDGVIRGGSNLHAGCHHKPQTPPWFRDWTGNDSSWVQKSWLALYVRQYKSETSSCLTFLGTWKRWANYFWLFLTLCNVVFASVLPQEFTTKEIIGFCIGSVSSVLYLCSRLPQIYTNVSMTELSYKWINSRQSILG